MQAKSFVPALPALAVCVALAGMTAPAAPAVAGGAKGAADGGTGGVRLAEQVAVYDLELVRATRRSGIVQARGRIAVSMSGGGCAGWTSEMRMVTEYVFRRRGARVIDSRNTSWEAADGGGYRFASSRFDNGGRVRSLRLSARRLADGAVEVRFSQPAGRVGRLPAGTLFPVQATRELIAAARAGARQVRFFTYEGFEDGRARFVSALIGTAARKAQDGVKGLAGVPSWPVTMAYYPQGGGTGAQTPEYEISFRLHDNGVLEDLVLSYGDYALKGRLVKLRLGRREAACAAR